MTKTEELKNALKSKRLRYVGTRGDTAAPVCVIGEAPGFDEDVAGMPFVGASGKELDRMLCEAGFSLQDIWWTNPYKCRPPDNKLDRLPELGVALTLFEEQFWEELNVTKPTFIIACGATPLGLLCPWTVAKRTGKAEIGKWRGSLLQSPRLQWEHYVIPCHHPAFILREWSERPIAVLCLGKVKEELDYYRTSKRIQPLPLRHLIGDPSADDAIDFLRMCLNQNGPVSIDIENIGVYKGKYKTPQRNRVPYVVGFAVSSKEGMSIGLAEYEKEKTKKIWQLIDEVLRRKCQIGQNYYTHDAPWLEYLAFSPNIRLLDDTLVRHHVLWTELSHKLQFQTMQYTREPYYKDEGRNWSVKERQKLKRYNCKDVCVTYEIFERQEEEFASRPLAKDYYHNYSRPLMHTFYDINKRGIKVNPTKLAELRKYVIGELEISCKKISTLVGKPVVAKATPKKKLPPGTFNLSSTPQVVAQLKAFGMKLPTKRGRKSESSDEETLQQLYAETGHPFLKEQLRVRELNKVIGTYIDAELDNDILYSTYFVTGTITDRRSARQNFLGLGTNHQNQPKHSDLGKRYRECLVARKDRILINCDQVQAEDWLVQGIIADQSGDMRGLNELQSNIDRHRRLASYIFGKPEDQCGKDTPERFMGKKTRHAGNYDMQAFRFAGEMAKEGYTVSVAHCEFLLEKFHNFDPGIRGVFHKYIQSEMNTNRMLVTPFGFERTFFALRDYSDNKKIYKEGYAQIPQSTVGVNTGHAILWLEANHPGHVVMDGHDAVVLEVEDDIETILASFGWLQQAFDRVITLPKGLSFTIPIEIEIGYDLQHMKKCDNLSKIGLRDIIAGLKVQAKAPTITTTGAPQPSSEQHSSVTLG